MANGIETMIEIEIGIVIGIVIGIGIATGIVIVTGIETGDSDSMMITITRGGKTMIAGVIDAIDAHYTFAA